MSMLGSDGVGVSARVGSRRWRAVSRSSPEERWVVRRSGLCREAGQALRRSMARAEALGAVAMMRSAVADD